ncbi:cytoplasmic protein [Pelomyxa schiedti]|nr:cytoplasmic protein [Pelomyxa schiedti]
MRLWKKQSMMGNEAYSWHHENRHYSLELNEANPSLSKFEEILKLAFPGFPNKPEKLVKPPATAVKMPLTPVRDPTIQPSFSSPAPAPVVFPLIPPTTASKSTPSNNNTAAAPPLSDTKADDVASNSESDYDGDSSGLEDTSESNEITDLIHHFEEVLTTPKTVDQVPSYLPATPIKPLNTNRLVLPPTPSPFKIIPSIQVDPQAPTLPLPIIPPSPIHIDEKDAHTSQPTHSDTLYPQLEQTTCDKPKEEVTEILKVKSPDQIDWSTCEIEIDTIGCLYSVDENDKEELFIRNCKIQIVKCCTFLYALRIFDDTKDLITQRIGPDMHYSFIPAQHALVWIYSFAALKWTWKLVLESEATFQSVTMTLTKASYEYSTKKLWSKLKEEDKPYLARTNSTEIDLDTSGCFEDDDGLQEEDTHDFFEEDDDGSELTSRSTSSIASPAASEGTSTPTKSSCTQPSTPISPIRMEKLSFDDSDKKDSEAEEEDTHGGEESEGNGESENDETENHEEGENRMLAIGNNTDRSFVVRGSSIGVYGTQGAGGKWTHKASISKLSHDSHELHPSQVMLHQADQTMLLLDPDHSRSVFRLDLNSEKVVEEWQADGNYEINQVLPQTKYAPMTDQQTFLGLNNHGFCLLDPRLRSTHKMVPGQSFFYPSRGKTSNISCGVTTKTGHVAVATTGGEIKLFSANSISKKRRPDCFEAAVPRAKTTLPAFGEPIKAIDATADGKWLLATCKTYLLVVPTELKSGKLGFEVPMGKEKPSARRLSLKQSHLRVMTPVDFTPAKFNMEWAADTGKLEKSIVTSTGPYVVTWNFRKIKQNILDQYKVKKYNTDIVADNFWCGDTDQVVVTLPHSVVLSKKSAPLSSSALSSITTTTTTSDGL